MKSIFEMIITTPLGYIISFIYSLIQNYGLAIIIFTILVKIIIAPLMVKQQNSMLQMQKLQPELAKIQKKYANDKNRLNEETMKLYQSNNVNPAGGCLPLLIQFPIIIGLYQVVMRPMQYIMHLSFENVQKIADALKFTADIKHKQIELSALAAKNIDLISSKTGLEINPINFDFLGMDLSLTPDFKVLNLLWIIPILSALTAYLSSVISTKLSGNTQQNEQMKSMNVIMPLMSAYFCFILPAGIGIYWIMSNVMQIVLQYVITIILKKKGEKLNA